MVKLFDPDEFAAPPKLADPIAFSDSDRARSPRTAKARPEAIRAALAGASTLTEAWAQLPPEERHINSIRALLSQTLHEGAGFDRGPGARSNSNKSTAPPAPPTSLSSRSAKD